jgi:hypothetical protein
MKEIYEYNCTFCGKGLNANEAFMCKSITTTTCTGCEIKAKEITELKAKLYDLMPRTY